MPIIEKIDRARGIYAGKLADFRKAAAAEKPGTDYEKDLIQRLAEMIEIKTEIEILTRVEQHRAQAAREE